MSITQTTLAFIRRCLLLALTVAAQCAYAADSGPWGSLDNARSVHKEYFVPGSVYTAVINGESSFVICGSAQRDFDNKSDETDQELWGDTEISAKNILLTHVGGASGHSYDVTGRIGKMTKLYAWVEKDTYYAVYSTPERSVKVVATQNVATSKQPVVGHVSAPIKTVSPSMHSGIMSNNIDAINRRIQNSAIEKLKQGDNIEENLKILAEDSYRQGSFPDAVINYQNLIRQQKETGRFSPKDILRAARAAEQSDSASLALKYYKKLAQNTSIFSKYHQEALKKIDQLSAGVLNK